MLDLKLADLTEPFASLGIGLFSGSVVAFIEDIGRTVEHLPLPGGDHRGVDTESTGQLGSDFFV